jgi:hypothetical protein
LLIGARAALCSDHNDIRVADRKIARAIHHSTADSGGFLRSGRHGE